MTRKTLFTLLALAGLTLCLAAGPIVAQTSQTTQSTTNTAKSDKSPKKSKTDKSTSSNNLGSAAAANPSTSTPPPAASGTGKSPAPSAAATTPKPTTPVAAAQKGMVWVNTSSGVYHYEGTKYNGNTKQGVYMSEADAQKAGYRPAKESGSKTATQK